MQENRSGEERVGTERNSHRGVKAQREEEGAIFDVQYPTLLPGCRSGWGRIEWAHETISASEREGGGGDGRFDRHRPGDGPNAENSRVAGVSDGAQPDGSGFAAGRGVPTSGTGFSGS